jgi:aminopeptidase N
MAIPATSSFWNLALADPGPTGLFASPVYNRGAATLHALRQKIGDAAFLAGAQLWLERYDDGDATTEDFEAVYEEASGQDLSAFFDVWLRDRVKPTSW